MVHAAPISALEPSGSRGEDGLPVSIQGEN